MLKQVLHYVIIFSLITLIPFSIYPQDNSTYGEEKTTTNNQIGTDKKAEIAFAISFGAVLLIMYAASKIIKRGNVNVKFLDIIRDKDWYPSLSIFQFFIWTFVVLFAFFGIYLFRVFSGITDPPTISDMPESLLILMGISFVVPVTSSGLSSIKYVSSVLGGPKPPKDKLPGYSTMLNENGKPTLTRFQMFSWTWISIAIYLVILSSAVSEVVNNEISAKDLTLPDIDPALVVLMGISQGAYLGGKITMKQKLEIIEVFPKKEKIDSRITISGTNFGDKIGIVIIGGMALRADKIEKWSDNMIVVKIPQMNEGKTTLQIVANGIISSEIGIEVTK